MSSRELFLPCVDREMLRCSVPDPRSWSFPSTPLRSRVAYSAAHVVADPLAPGDPLTSSELDWDATLAYRRLLWSYGLGVAEAMDTAQRGMGLDWKTAAALIERSSAEAKSVNGLIACGAGTDHLASGHLYTLDQVREAYELQCAHVERCGSRIILMASRALAASAQSPDDYRYVYGSVLRQASQPVILHWLGAMFDPALSGYWGCLDTSGAIAACVALIGEFRSKIDGIKLSLLDASLEVQMRRQLPSGVRMYTGDDFAYPDLIRGDQHGYSDALLGIFDAIAPAASCALQALDRNDVDAFDRILAPTVPLSRLLFESPTYSYKTGIVFLAYLNGYQRHFRMLGGRESARSILHLSSVFKLASEAGLLIDPDLACQRMRLALTLAGVV